MRLGLIIGLLLSAASIYTSSLLFWNAAPKSSSKRTTLQPSIDIKWGEGSEAGTPETAGHK